jgi:hypothetical protein
MDGWDFPKATDAMEAAVAVLATRDRLLATAATLGLTAPVAFEADYQSAGSSSELTVLGERMTASLGALDAIASASTAAAAPRDWLADLGFGAGDADAELAAARTAWQAGDAGGAKSAADALAARLASASDAGRSRVLAVGMVAGLALLLLVVAAWAVMRRPRRRVTVTAHPGEVRAWTMPDGVAGAAAHDERAAHDVDAIREEDGPPVGAPGPADHPARDPDVPAVRDPDVPLPREPGPPGVRDPDVPDVSRARSGRTAWGSLDRPVWGDRQGPRPPEDGATDRR